MLNFKKFLTLNTALITLSIGVVCLNTSYLSIHSFVKYRKHLEVLEPGSQFSNFKPHLEGVKEIGYITTKDLSPEKNDGAYLQAQYYLAPTIIHLDQDKHKFNIIDADSIPFILGTIRRINARKVAHNEFGQALIKRQ